MGSNANLPPYYNKIMEKNRVATAEMIQNSRYIPGPGQYDNNIGFDGISSKLAKAK